MINKPNRNWTLNSMRITVLKMFVEFPFFLHEKGFALTSSQCEPRTALTHPYTRDGIKRTVIRLFGEFITWTSFFVRSYGYIYRFSMNYTLMSTFRGTANILSELHLSTNARKMSQKKTDGEREDPMCLCEVAFFFSLYFFHSLVFWLISSRCFFVVRLVSVWLLLCILFDVSCVNRLLQNAGSTDFAMCERSFSVNIRPFQARINSDSLCESVCSTEHCCRCRCSRCYCCSKQSAVPTTPLICIFHLIRSLHSLWKLCSLYRSKATNLQQTRAAAAAAAPTNCNEQNMKSTFHINFVLMKYWQEERSHVKRMKKGRKKNTCTEKKESTFHRKQITSRIPNPVVKPFEIINAPFFGVSNIEAFFFSSFFSARK